MNKKEKTNLLTSNPEVILASNSKTRQNILNLYKIKYKAVKHLTNETCIKNTLLKEKKTPTFISLELAKNKAESLKHKYTNSIIIGSDQVLVCQKKIYDKASSSEEAINKLMELQGKKHTLISSIYIIKKEIFLWSCTKKATLFFYPLEKKRIQEYVLKNQKTVFSSVGCYKIEQNEKYNFIKIIDGEDETIKGFPIKNFIKKFKY
ncbi:MAG: hypothetical protein CBE14_002155 [Rickettsiales bacterium TMED254]|nr:hypothetical protein [Rickettsiales bacterium]RPF76615.1 MAG: hypothetical protein CBE14_002155 [Rickettsiales bacterium TMED254]